MSGNTAAGGRRGGSRWRIAAWVTAAALLLLPLFAMQVTDEVVWTAADFGFASVLLAVPLVSYELAATKTANTAYRVAVAGVLAAAFLLVWVNAAVGIMGSEGRP